MEFPLRLIILMAAFWIYAPGQSIQSQAAEAKVDIRACAAKVRSIYSEYMSKPPRTAAPRDGAVTFFEPPPGVPPLNYEPRYLFPHGYRPALSDGLVNCAANDGDSLALYLRGERRLERDQSADGVVAAMRDFRLATITRRGPKRPCTVSTKEPEYECQDGLPEAHLALGRIYANCSLGQRNWAQAQSHLGSAYRNGLYQAQGVLVTEADCPVAQQRGN